MIRLAANISTLFQEVAFGQRAAAAAGYGFRAIETQFLDSVDVSALGAAARDAGVEVVLINAASGNAADGEFGLAGLPREVERFRNSVESALASAHTLSCPRIHVLSGRRRQDLTDEMHWDCLLESYKWAAARAREQQVDIMIEPLNNRMVPDYLVTTLADALSLADSIDVPNLKIQFDLYHMQIMGGDILARFAAAQRRIGHIQIASVPARAEPDRGELDIHFILREIDKAGYGGWIGCEYVPAQTTGGGLRWASAYGLGLRPSNSLPADVR